MKGIVEIYGTTDDGKKDLLYQGENMTTVGFSENIVDMLTLPSSIVSSTESGDYLNPENYIINAFSMSKAKDQFKKNLHAYSTTNLLHYSKDLTKAIYGLSPFASIWGRTNLEPASAVDIETVDYESSAFLLDTITSGGSLSQEILYDDSWAGAYASSYFSATDFVFSIDMKMNTANPPIQVSSGPNGEYRGYTQLAISGNGAASGMFFEWDESGIPTVFNRDTGYNFADNLGGIKSLGGGWYRAFVYSKYDSGGDSAKTIVYIYPSLGPLGEHLVGKSYKAKGKAGSIFVSRPQLELGIHPTNYVETSALSPRDSLLKYSRLNSTPPYGTDVDGSAAINYYVVSDSGGPTLSGIYDETLDKGVSAYIPSKNELIPTANPEDRELTPGARTPVEEAFNVQITKGQISDCQHMWDRLRVDKYDNSWHYAKNYKPYFGRHLTYVGAFSSRNNWVPSGSLGTNDQNDSTKIQVTNWVHYVSAYDENGYASPLSSVSLSGGWLTNFNKASTPDMDGFIPVLNYAISAGPGDTNDTAANWVPGCGWRRNVMQSQIHLDFSSTGEVTYHLRQINMSGNSDFDFISPPVGVDGVTLNSDSVLLNLFGGVDVIGLWGFDLKKIRADDTIEDTLYRYPFVGAGADRATIDAQTKDSEAAPNKNHPWDPYRRYKLYSKKVLTDNIMKNEGFGTSAGIFTNYKNLDLYWKVKFL